MIRKVDMATKIIRFQPVAPSTQHGRTFEIAITSDPSGYQAQVTELLYGGGSAEIVLPNGPRTEIHPSSFFKMREHYRGMLHSDVLAEITRGVVVRASGADQGKYLCYARANMMGWPDGHPEATSDDMAYWISD